MCVMLAAFRPGNVHGGKVGRNFHGNFIYIRNFGESGTFMEGHSRGGGGSWLPPSSSWQFRLDRPISGPVFNDETCPPTPPFFFLLSSHLPPPPPFTEEEMSAMSNGLQHFQKRDPCSVLHTCLERNHYNASSLYAVAIQCWGSALTILQLCAQGEQRQFLRTSYSIFQYCPYYMIDEIAPLTSCSHRSMLAQSPPR